MVRSTISTSSCARATRETSRRPRSRSTRKRAKPATGGRKRTASGKRFKAKGRPTQLNCEILHHERGSTVPQARGGRSRSSRPSPTGSACEADQGRRPSVGVARFEICYHASCGTMLHALLSRVRTAPAVVLRWLVLGTVSWPLFALLATPIHALPEQPEKWVRIVTPHFVIDSNAGENQARNVGVSLERFRGLLESDVDSTGARTPTTIVAFADNNAFRPYKLMANGSPYGYVGVFAPTPDGNFIGMNLDPHEDPYGTVFHEYVHFANSKRYLDLPRWLEEGMAEYYSSFRIDGDNLEVGRPIENHVIRLAVEPLLSFAELFELEGDAHGPQTIDDRDDSQRESMFYAESWALYHYLTLGKKELRPKLDRFLESWKGEVHANAAWKAAFGVDYEPIEAALKEYAAGGTFNYMRIHFDDLPPIEVRLEPLTRADLLRDLGEYL